LSEASPAFHRDLLSNIVPGRGTQAPPSKVSSARTTSRQPSARCAARGLVFGFIGK
jgi:hypothetical protein